MWKYVGRTEVNNMNRHLYLSLLQYSYAQQKDNDQQKPNTFYRVLLTNHVNLWKKVFTMEAFQEMMVSSNQEVEAEDIEFSKAGFQLLLTPSKEDKKTFMLMTNGNMNVEFLRLGPIVWKANFVLTLCNAEELFNLVTGPLLNVIKDQIDSTHSLRRQLIKKDQEIQGCLEMLPENSPLMRCLRTKKYDDKEHQTKHCALTKLFGPGVENISQQQQLEKEPVPVVDNENNATNSSETQQGPTTAMKMESADDSDSKANTVLNPEVKHELNQNDAKTESNDNTSGLVHVKIEPIEPIPVKIEPHDDTFEPKDVSTTLNENQPETSGVSPTSVKPDSESTTTGDNMDLSIADNGLTQNTTDTLHSKSPEKRTSQPSPASTPKKPRKQLNY